MWTKLKYCNSGDLIRAYWLNDEDIENPDNCNWHLIFEIKEERNGKYYVAIQGWRGRQENGEVDVFKRPVP